MTGQGKGKLQIPSSTIDVIMGLTCDGHYTMGEESELDNGIDGV